MKNTRQTIWISPTGRTIMYRNTDGSTGYEFPAEKVPQHENTTPRMAV